MGSVTDRTLLKFLFLANVLFARIQCLIFTLLETFSLCGPKLSASCWIFVFNYKEKPNVLINYFAVCLFALF